MTFLYATKARSPELRRAYWLKITLVVAFFSGFLLSLKLWGSDRFFPLAPVFEFLPPIPASFDYLLLGLMFLWLVAIALIWRSQKLIWGFLILAFGFSLWDQNRWQPWFYQYLWMLGALSFYPWQKSDANNRKASLNICRLIVVSLYFWSGIQKMNVLFLQEVFPWMLEPFSRHWPESLKQLVNLTGYAVPFIETAIGLGLLTRRFRPISLGLAIAMHLFILLCIGPLGHGVNSVIWPWNLAMIAFLLLLFVRTESITAKSIIGIKNSLPHKIGLVFFGIMPFFSFFDLWDSYLSAALYSGNIAQAHIFIEESVKKNLPSSLGAHLSKTESRAGYKLNLLDWSSEAVGVPPYPEARFYRRIAHSLCDYATQPNDVILIIEEKADWLSGKRNSSVYNCVSQP